MELDIEQQAVVESDESMVVVAPPGGGKTRVLTEKARRLFSEGKNIICLCFTRSAAREMQSRVSGLPACTIHSYCCGAIGWKIPRGASQEDGYPYLLQRFLWEQDGTKYDWVLIDECQDLNPMELDVALSLVGDKLFVVGDPFQSIYGFQGAVGPDVIRLLEKVGCRRVELHNNYRSDWSVIEKLNGIFDRKLVSSGVKDTGLTAILCRKNDDLFEVSEYLKKVGVKHRVRLAASVAGARDREYDVLGESNLRLMTIHASKGHEFDRVLLYNWKPNERGEEERVYYTACARASKQFIEVKNPVQLMKEI